MVLSNPHGMSYPHSVNRQSVHRPNLLYRTDPQTHRLDRFLKFPELSGQVGISRIPSKNTDRKITNLSGKHSFTLLVSYTLFYSISPSFW